MITIFSSESCPRCAVIKSKLQNINVEFSETHDLEEVEKLGFTQLPVIKMNDKYYSFKEMNEYINNYKAV